MWLLEDEDHMSEKSFMHADLLAMSSHPFTEFEV